MSICNRFHVRRANSGKITISKGVPLFDEKRVYLTWPWIGTASWQTDKRTDSIAIANTRSAVPAGTTVARKNPKIQPFDWLSICPCPNSCCMTVVEDVVWVGSLCCCDVNKTYLKTKQDQDFLLFSTPTPRWPIPRWKSSFPFSCLVFTHHSCTGRYCWGAY